MVRYIVKPTGPFRKDLKLAKRRDFPLDDLYTVVGLLEEGEPLPEKYHNHLLLGDYKGYWECHITPDWLLLNPSICLRAASVMRHAITLLFMLVTTTTAWAWSGEGTSTNPFLITR